MFFLHFKIIRWTWEITKSLWVEKQMQHTNKIKIKESKLH